jgi:hypothetical protein
MGHFGDSLEEAVDQSISSALEAWIWAFVAAVAAALFVPLWSIVRQLIDNPKGPIQLSAPLSAYLLILLLAIGTAIGLLLVFARAKIQELKELRKNRSEATPQLSSSTPKNGDTFEDARFEYDGAAWIPTLLYVDGGARNTVSAKGPICPPCGAPLYSKDSTADSFAICPTCDKSYNFRLVIAELRKKAKFHAIGLYGDGKFSFGGVVKGKPRPSSASAPTGRLISPEIVYERMLWKANGRKDDFGGFKIVDLDFSCIGKDGNDCDHVLIAKTTNRYVNVYCPNPKCRWEETFDVSKWAQVKVEVSALIKTDFKKIPEKFKPA